MGGIPAGALMKVGLIIYGDLETLTGGYLYDRRLVNYLRAQGDQVEVISLPWRNYGRHLTDNLSRRLSRRLREAELDVVIQDELRCSEPHPAWLRRIYEAVERKYLKTVDGAIFNCHTTRAAVRQLVGRDIPGVVAYPGRDHLNHEFSLAEVAQRASRPGPLRVIFLANVIPGKGLNTLIEALGRLTRGSWRLTVVGSLTMDPSYSQSVRNQIARAGLSDYVDLVGAVPNDETPGHLIRNDILVVPSRYEALGIVYLEAMGFGLPVIATSAGGAHEIVDHGEAGFLTTPGDADMLARYLREINQERGRLLEMSLAAYNRVSTHPTWDESFGRVRDFLQTLIRNQRDSRLEPGGREG
jgi:glycosyltransferase involved in cell wall biosynthesis